MNPDHNPPEVVPELDRRKAAKRRGRLVLVGCVVALVAIVGAVTQEIGLVLFIAVGFALAGGGAALYLRWLHRPKER
jgi:hypothetical protein